MSPNIIQNMDFNSGEFGPPDGQPENNEVQVENIVNDLFGAKLAPTPSNGDNESYMLEADKRIGVAQYYRQLTKGTIFSPATEESSIVEKEIKDFCISRLQVLLSMNSAPTMGAKSPFSESEVKVLKLFANWSEAEINILRSIVSKVTGGITKPTVVNTVTQPTEVKPSIVQISTNVPQAKPVPKVEENPKRGRPAKVEKEYQTVTDPVTGQEIKSLITKPQKNPLGIPFPSPGAMAAITTARAAEAASKASEVSESFVTGLR